MATHWVVFVAATVCLSLGGHGNLIAAGDPLTAPCAQEPVVVTPSPPPAPCLSQSIEKVGPVAVPYVTEAVEEVLLPAGLPTLVPLAPGEVPCQKTALPLPTPLPFALPAPAFQSPMFSFLSQAQSADPATALNTVSRMLSTALPWQLQAAASFPAQPPPAPVAAIPAPSVTYVAQTPPTALIDTQTLLSLGLLQPLTANLAAQPTALPLDASALFGLGALQPAAAPVEQPGVLNLGALQPANLGLTQLSPELLAQLTLSAVPATALFNPAAAPAPCAAAPAAPPSPAAPAAPAAPQLIQPSYTLPSSTFLPVPTAVAPNPSLEALSEFENSKIGQVKNAWSKLYEPLRRLRTHVHSF